MSLPTLLSRLIPSVFKGEAPACRVLMVCMGNICRSPTAEAVLRHKLQQAGLGERVQVDSAGTYGGHAGCPPDERARQHAARRGYDLAPLRARKVQAQDFSRFDLLLAMDADNLSYLMQKCPAGLPSPPSLARLTDFLPAGSPFAGTQAVPDPYYGGPAGFDHVLDLVEAACDGLVEHLRQVVGSVASRTNEPGGR